MKYLSAIFLTLLISCSGNKEEFDASGNFEADEVIVSAEVAGKVLSFPAEEGQSLTKGQLLLTIDTVPLLLQKEQVKASISALAEKTADVNPQVQLLNDQLAVQQSQLAALAKEQKRTENLLKLDAATGKQLDDINAQIDLVTKQADVTRQQIRVQKNNTGTQNRAILSEAGPLEERIRQLNDQLARTKVTAPVSGTLLTKYAEAGEVTSPGKALFKMADLSTITLRAYISGSQLAQVKTGQQVNVLVDKDKENYKTYPGTVLSVADKAEFTPKTIQTKDERANLVYAVRISVRNDGYLKIGMFGEVKF